MPRASLPLSKPDQKVHIVIKPFNAAILNEEQLLLSFDKSQHIKIIAFGIQSPQSAVMHALRPDELQNNAERRRLTAGFGQPGVSHPLHAIAQDVGIAKQHSVHAEPTSGNRHATIPPSSLAERTAPMRSSGRQFAKSTAPDRNPAEKAHSGAMHLSNPPMPPQGKSRQC